MCLCEAGVVLRLSESGTMNGHSDIDTNEATQHLKNILNLGKGESDAERKSIANGDMETSGDLSVGGFGIKNPYPSLYKGPEDQQLILPGNEDETNISILGQDVAVYSSPMHHGSGRSKIKIESIVDYGWEQKYYLGKLVCMHISGIYLAYAIRAPQTPHGFVRVIKHGTNVRALLKGAKGEVKDLAFSHSTSQVLLGFVDQVGELFVYEVADMGEKIVCNSLVHIVRYPEPKPSDNHRIIWCPYIPDDLDSIDDLGDSPNSDDVASLLVVTHDEKAEIWNVDLLVKEHGTGDIPAEKVKVGLQIISEHKLPISTATFSPDGTALATASFDGDVKFFQVNMDVESCESSPRCLHQWTPHGGKPLSMMFFLDNHKNHNPDVQFWKFAITGADNNQEIKLWSCESWSCLQTIRFYPNREDNVQPCLKADLDLSSQYLFLSDINRKVMYILQILQEPSISKARICSLSEFSLTYPVLSLAITDVSRCVFKPLSPVTADSEGKDKDGDGEEESNDVDKLEGCLVKLFWIHTKSLQSCRIKYRPTEEFPFHSAESIGSLSQDSFVYRDRLSDIHMDAQDSKSESENDLSAEKGITPSNPNAVLSPPSASLSSNVLGSVSSHLSNYKTCDDILLTPEDFTSPSHTTVPSTAINNSYVKLPSVEETSPRLPPHEKNSEPDDIPSIPAESGVVPRRKSSQHSSTSSPSREVAEILDHSKLLNCEDHDVLRIVKVKKEPAALDSLSNDNLLKSEVMQEAGDISRNQPEYPTGEWPQAPDPHKEYRIASRSEGEVNIQLSPREQLTPSRHSCKREESLRGSETVSPDAFNSETKCMLVTLNGAIERLSQQVGTITDILHSQRQEIQEVQNEIQELHNSQKHVQNNLQALDDLDNTVALQVERVIASHSVLAHDRLDAMFNQREEAGQQSLDRQISTLSQNVVGGVNSKIDKTVKNEMKSAVIPQITKHLDIMKDQLQVDMQSRMSTVDNSLRDCISKHIKSKQFNDAVSQSLCSQLQPQIQSACKEVFQNTIIPSMEKVCHSLFMQMNDCFQRGLIEFFQHMDMHRQMLLQSIEASVKNTQEQVKELIGNTQSFCDKSVTKLQEQQTDSQKNHEILVETLKQCVQKEVHRAFAEQPQTVVALRSQAVTPVPTQDRQITHHHIMNLVKQGQLNEAFQQALSAADLPLVISLCESVSLDKVFGGSTCHLQQHVLLSLIHQLSGDLQVKTELKVKYIEVAVTHLDSSSPITRVHVAKVVGSLQHRISIFLQNNPNHKFTHNLRLMQLALQSMTMIN